MYKLFVSGVVPRPIAFVSSESENGTQNLAPFRCALALFPKRFTIDPIRLQLVQHRLLLPSYPLHLHRQPGQALQRHIGQHPSDEAVCGEHYFRALRAERECYVYRYAAGG